MIQLIFLWWFFIWLSAPIWCFRLLAVATIITVLETIVDAIVAIVEAYENRE